MTGRFARRAEEAAEFDVPENDAGTGALEDPRAAAEAEVREAWGKLERHRASRWERIAELQNLREQREAALDADAADEALGLDRPG
jgi:hypothetical protein